MNKKLWAKDTLRVSDLIKILKTMPQDAIIVSDDGTGWLAKVRGCDIWDEDCEDFTFVRICGNGDGI